MNNSRHVQLIKFLEEDLDVSNASITMALKHSQNDPGPLPIVLWQYGLVTLDQLNQIYDWLEQDLSSRGMMTDIKS